MSNRYPFRRHSRAQLRAYPFAWHTVIPFQICTHRISDEEYAAIYEYFIESPEPSSSHDTRLTHPDYSSQPYLPMSTSSSSCLKQLSNPPEFDRQVKYEVNEYLSSAPSLHFDTDYQDSKRTKGTRVKTHTFRNIEEEATSHTNESTDVDKLYYLPSLSHTGDAQPGPFTKLNTMSAQYIPTSKPLEADLYISPRDITRGIHDVKYSSLMAHVPCRQNLKRKVDDLTRQTGQRTSSLASQPQKKTQTGKRRRLEQNEKVSAEIVAYHVLHSKSYGFKCPLCHEVKISRKSATDFIRHIRSHGKASYQCERCGASLSRRDALKRHKRSKICDPS